MKLKRRNLVRKIANCIPGKLARSIRRRERISSRFNDKFRLEVDLVWVIWTLLK
ncbi:MAG: hypothetical protein ACFFD2_11305 [Promethearchaeota archaeon]